MDEKKKFNDQSDSSSKTWLVRNKNCSRGYRDHLLFMKNTYMRHDKNLQFMAFYILVDTKYKVYYDESKVLVSFRRRMSVGWVKLLFGCGSIESDNSCVTYISLDANGYYRELELMYLFEHHYVKKIIYDNDTLDPYSEEH